MTVAHSQLCFHPNGSPAASNGGPQQVGLAAVVLSRQQFVAALNVPMADLTLRLGLNVERSFSDQPCLTAYFELGEDAFSVVLWDDASDVHLYAYVESPDDGVYYGQDEISRFLRGAGIDWKSVTHPAPGHPAYGGPAHT